MKHKKLILILGCAVVAVLVAAGIFVYLNFFKVEKASLSDRTVDLSSVQPQLKYAGAYNGQLYLTSEKTGFDAPYDLLVKNMDRNGVTTVIAYFGIEGESKTFGTQSVNQIIKTVKAHPARFLPFYSPALDSEEAADMVGDELTGIFKTGLDATKKAVPGMFMKGIGEVENQTWQTSLASPEGYQLFDLASQNDLDVMLHIRPDQGNDLEFLLKRYPNTTFLLHLFANDFDRSRTAIINLMERYPNLIFTIDADHMMFDKSGQPPIGLLYKFGEGDPKVASENFNREFDAKFDTLLQQAIERYQPLIAAVPEQVTIGTEMHNSYTYEPEAYDRTIKFIRHFIARQDPSVQENLAIKNAQRIFGNGVTLE